jgi:hypothetical protein
MAKKRSSKLEPRFFASICCSKASFASFPGVYTGGCGEKDALWGTACPERRGAGRAERHVLRRVVTSRIPLDAGA